MADRVEPAIEAENVVMKFGSSVVHDGVTFSIPRGTIAAVIGGSGSGKSTLLKEIIGLLEPTSGKLKIFGQSVWDASEEELKGLRRRFGVLFQNGALFSALTVGENVAVPFREQADLSEELIESLVQLRLSLTGLPSDTALKMPSELSGGMRKRVGLARALALEPEIVFLDEPTSGLDPINARAFDSLVKTLSDSLGLTIVMVTHDLDTIVGIAEQLIVLDRGKVIANGTVPEVQAVNHQWIKNYFSSRAQ
ncbi:MAG: ATP-binding cassette domain-containing protein [Bdellovibrionota bacterium]